jgi:hypothetical protein
VQTLGQVVHGLELATQSTVHSRFVAPTRGNPVSVGTHTIRRCMCPADQTNIKPTTGPHDDCRDPEQTPQDHNTTKEKPMKREQRESGEGPSLNPEIDTSNRKRHAIPVRRGRERRCAGCLDKIGRIPIRTKCQQRRVVLGRGRALFHTQTYMYQMR